MLRCELAPSEKDRVRRSESNTELELRFVTPGTHALDRRLFVAIRDGLARRAVETVLQEYTNRSWSTGREPTSYRLTESRVPVLSPVLMKKSRLHKLTLASYVCFDVNLAESRETEVIDQSIVTTLGTPVVRDIKRRKYTIERAGAEYTYDCSEVTQGAQVTYEIEYELPFDMHVPAHSSLAERALHAISQLMEMAYEPYHVPPLFRVPSRADMLQVTQDVALRTRTESANGRLNVRNDPVNVKRDDLARLDAYAMTNKLDGERKFVVTRGALAWVFGSGGWNPRKPDSCYCLPIPEAPDMMLDTEYERLTFHVFDVLYAPGVDGTTETHARRMAALDGVSLDAARVVRKRFYTGTLAQNLAEFMRSDPGEWYDRNDGLIFTSKTGAYRTTKHLKFKFVAKMSIDFQLALQRDTNEHQHVFDLGVSRYDPASRTTKVVPFGKREQLITYETYELPLIVECTYHAHDQRWVVLRARDDKEYPNSERVANENFADIRHPITFDDLVASARVANAAFTSLIRDRESTRLIDSYRARRRVFALALDLSPSRAVEAFANHFGKRDAAFVNEVYRLLHQAFYTDSSDQEVLQRVFALVKQPTKAYAVHAEAEFLRTVVAPHATHVWDARTTHVVDVCRLEVAEPALPPALRALLEPGDATDTGTLLSNDMHAQLQTWYPRSSRMVLIKAMRMSHVDAWRALFPNTVAYENESSRVQAMTDVVYDDGAVTRAAYFDAAVLTGYFRDDLYVSAQRDDAHRAAVVARAWLRSGHAQSVVIIAPVAYQLVDPLLQVERHVFGQSVLLRVTPARPPRVESSAAVVWSIPYIDQYARLFETTTGESHVLARIPKDIVTESLTALIQAHHLPPFSVAPWRLLDASHVEQAAARAGFQHVATYDSASNRLHRYVHYRRGAAPSAPIIEPAASCDPPERNTMRKFHNEIKASLIRRFCRARRVMDLGAGYGGDLHKYTEAEVTSLVLVEPSLDHIKSAQPEGLEKRLETMAIRKRAHIVHTTGQDTSTILQQEIVPNGRVQVVASFFSMTFLFASRDLLRSFLRTVNVSLTEGGYFIGTMMEGEKAFEALHGVDRKRYGDVEIVKQYRDTDPRECGMKLWINIDHTIVQNQNEYLAFFSILREEMEALEFELVTRAEFRPELHYEDISDENQAFSRLNIGFAFRKMPKRIDAEVRMLDVGTSVEFINLYGDEQILVRTGVPPDGNCFYHAYLYNTSNAYRTASEAGRARQVVALRAELADWLTVDRMMELTDSVQPIHQRVADTLRGDDLRAYLAAFSPQYFEQHVFSAQAYLAQLATLPEAIQTMVAYEVQRWFEKLQAAVRKPGSWADERHIALLTTFRDVNIYLIDSTTRRPVALPIYKPQRRYSTALMVMNNVHFEPIGFVSHGFAKRVLAPFDANLVKLHHELEK